MTATVQSTISEIALSLETDGKPKFGISALQARLDGVIQADFEVEVDREDLEDLLSAELYEANGYDELPEELQPAMVRNAHDLGRQRANILLQAALAMCVAGTQHITGSLDARDFTNAHEIAERSPGLLSDLMAQRRMILLNRVGEA